MRRCSSASTTARRIIIVVRRPCSATPTRAGRLPRWGQEREAARRDSDAVKPLLLFIVFPSFKPDAKDFVVRKRRGARGRRARPHEAGERALNCRHGYRFASVAAPALAGAPLCEPQDAITSAPPEPGARPAET